MSDEWLIVIGADGTIIATAEGAPADWRARRIDDPALPPELRESAGALASDSSRSGSTLQTTFITLPQNQQRVRLLALCAMPLRRSATNLSHLLRSAVGVMKEQAEALEVALTLDVTADLPETIFIDPEKLAWIVTALLGNALRFVRRGSRLMPGGAIVVRARHSAADAQVVIEVQDDGTGIAADRLRDLLQRSIDRPHVTGLGLLLVRDVVAAHGGRMDVTSRTDSEQSGTTVRLTLPCR